MFGERIRTKVMPVFHWLNRHLGGILDILITTGKRFDEVHGSEAAASIAYYGVFSLFPLLLFLVSVLGYLLNNVGSPIEIASTITKAFPISNDFVYNNLVQILGARNISGIIGLVGLMWAGSSVFFTVSRNINRAWPDAQTRNVLQHRLVAFIMIIVLLFLVAGWFISNVVFNLVPSIVIPFYGEISIFETNLWNNLSHLIPLILAFLVLLGLYRWIPNTEVKWREALWGAFTASLLLNLATRIFTWFISSGIASFEVIYGSLGAGFAILVWVYICALIVVLGAHLCASIAHVKRINQHKETDGG